MARRRETPGLKLRLAAAERLTEVLKGGQFAPLSASEISDPRDRALANRLVTTALRRHGHLSLVIAELLERGIPKRTGPFEALLRLSIAQLLYLPELGDHSALFLAVEATRTDTRMQHLGKLLNAVLRKAQAEAPRYRALPPELLFPERLRELWAASYGASAIAAFADALLDGAPLDLTLRDSDPDLVAALKAAPVLADTVRIAERDRPVSELPGFADGRWWVQDAAAAIPARLLHAAPGAPVLDLCAAPGGKTAQLLAAGYAVTALDNDAGRLERLNENLARLRLTAEIVEADAETYRPERRFAGILLDAPCSATGTFRRHPEVVWHRDATDVAGRAALQQRLLRNAATSLAPGGMLIYCVCSLEPAEGETQAGWVADTLPELAPDPIQATELPGLEAAVSIAGHVRTHPGMTAPGSAAGTLDGFFVARFRRR